MGYYAKLLRFPAAAAVFFVTSLVAALAAVAPPLLVQQLPLQEEGPALIAPLLLGIALVAIIAFTLLVLHVRAVRPALLSDVRLASAGIGGIARKLFLLCTLVAAFILIVSAVYGLVAMLAQWMLSPASGLQEVKGVIASITQVLTILVLPVPFMLLAGASLLDLDPKRAVVAGLPAFKRAYVPLLGSLAAAIGIGYLIWMLPATLPNETAGTAVRIAALCLLGTAWLPLPIAICAHVLPQTDDGRISGELPAMPEPWVSQRTRKNAHSALSCLLAFILAASLYGTARPAFAEEASPSTSTPPPTEVTQPQTSNPGAEITPPPEPDAKEPVAYYDEDEPQGEVVAADDQAVVYQTGERSFTTVIGGTPVAYTDADGDLKLIDNSLVPVADTPGAPYFTNTANSYTAKLPATISDTEGILIEKDGTSVELIPLEGDFTRAVAKDNAIRYTDVFAGIDYQYTLIGSLVKEDIVLNRLTERSTFSFEVNVGEGLDVVEDDGTIYVFDPSIEEGAVSSETAFLTITAPIMQDAAGEVSDALTLGLYQDSLGRHIATLTVDAAWLAAPERAYPVRIDPTIDIAPSAVTLVGVEQGAPDMRIGDNGYPYAGYDDGITSGNLANYGAMHLRTRTYAAINYNFGYIMQDARIDSATFSLHHYTAWSRGATSFGLYRVQDAWDPNTNTWNNQLYVNHEAIQYKNANANAGYIDWDVREVINNWVQGIYPQHGFVVKAQTESTTEQCEVFSNKASANPPRLAINWVVPDPVDEGYSLDSTTINLRTITEKDISGKLLFDGVFADGIATPRATVDYRLIPTDNAGTASASRSFRYPDSTDWQAIFPNGTAYKDKLSNWQSKLYGLGTGGLELDKAYRINATASLEGRSGAERQSDKFLIYQVKQKDTLPFIAKYYGVSLNTLIADNKVQDTLAVEKNTLFIRNPNTEIPYNPPPLTEDQKREIDSALIGRGKHCEYGYEPINLNTGNFWLEAGDVSIPDLAGDFALTRSYSSKGDRYQSVFGYGWDFEYAESLSAAADGTITYFTGDGKILFEVAVRIPNQDSRRLIHYRYLELLDNAGANFKKRGEIRVSETLKTYPYMDDR